MLATTSNPLGSNRLFEWTTGAMMFLMGILIIVNSDVLTVAGYKYILDFGVSPYFLSLMFIPIGATRVASLWINGHWPRHSPYLRAFCALIGSTVWAQLGLAQLISSQDIGAVPLGVVVYLCLTAGEIISAAKAIGDVRDR